MMITQQFSSDSEDFSGRALRNKLSLCYTGHCEKLMTSLNDKWFQSNAKRFLKASCPFIESFKTSGLTWDE